MDKEVTKEDWIDKDIYKASTGLYYSLQDYTEVCVKCGKKCNKMITYQRNHWAYCKDCKVRWWTGANLWSSPEMTDEELKKTEEILSEMEDADDIRKKHPLSEEDRKYLINQEKTRNPATEHREEWEWDVKFRY